MVDKPIADKVRYCIGANYVGFLETKLLRNFFLHIIMLNIALNKMDPIDWHHLKKINGNDAFRARS